MQPTFLVLINLKNNKKYVEKVLISKYATVTPYEKHMHLRN